MSPLTVTLLLSCCWWIGISSVAAGDTYWKDSTFEACQNQVDSHSTVVERVEPAYLNGNILATGFVSVSSTQALMSLKGNNAAQLIALISTEGEGNNGGYDVAQWVTFEGADINKGFGDAMEVFLAGRDQDAVTMLAIGAPLANSVTVYDIDIQTQSDWSETFTVEHRLENLVEDSNSDYAIDSNDEFGASLTRVQVEGADMNALVVGAPGTFGGVGVLYYIELLQNFLVVVSRLSPSDGNGLVSVTRFGTSLARLIYHDYFDGTSSAPDLALAVTGIVGGSSEDVSIIVVSLADLIANVGDPVVISLDGSTGWQGAFPLIQQQTMFAFSLSTVSDNLLAVAQPDEDNGKVWLLTLDDTTRHVEAFTQLTSAFEGIGLPNNLFNGYETMQFGWSVQRISSFAGGVPRLAVLAHGQTAWYFIEVDTQCDCEQVNAVGFWCSYPCQNSGTYGTFDTCNCTGTGRGGLLCADDMQCATNEMVYFDGSQNTCVCEPGWTGDNCDVDFDECADQPCGNTWACEESISDNGVNVGEYLCLDQCADGGELCKRAENTECIQESEDIVCKMSCTGETAADGGTAADEAESQTLCPAGYMCVGAGPEFYCATVCDLGAHLCNEFTGTCQVSDNGYICLCAPGFEGTDCSYMSAITNVTTPDSSSPGVLGDYCADSPCSSTGGLCSSVSRACTCFSGHFGEFCSLQPNANDRINVTLRFNTSYVELHYESVDEFLLELPGVLAKESDGEEEQFTIKLVEQGAEGQFASDNAIEVTVEVTGAAGGYAATTLTEQLKRSDIVFLLNSAETTKVYTGELGSLHETIAFIVLVCIGVFSVSFAAYYFYQKNLVSKERAEVKGAFQVPS